MPDVNVYGWQQDRFTECDRCHSEKPCCSVDFNDGSHEWDYCEQCWKVLHDRGVFENVWV